MFELPIPKPEGRRVLVKSHFSGVNAADLHLTLQQVDTLLPENCRTALDLKVLVLWKQLDKMSLDSKLDKSLWH